MSFAVKKRYRVLILLLCAAVLIAGAGFVYAHGEWWFPLTERLWHRAPDLTPVAPGIRSEQTAEELTASGFAERNIVLFLVNESHPLPESFVPELEEYNGAKMNPGMISFYVALRDEVERVTGTRIYVSSDYRSPEEQEQVFAESGAGVAAKPGCSEHGTGLALDVYAPYRAGMEFLNSRAGRETNRRCADFGFVIRYPVGKTDQTGISYEPWHLRFVGQPHAKVMTDAGLTLEEYIDVLTPEQFFKTGNTLILRTSASVIPVPEGSVSCTLSPDNTGHLICTFTME